MQCLAKPGNLCIRASASGKLHSAQCPHPHPLQFPSPCFLCSLPPLQVSPPLRRFFLYGVSLCQLLIFFLIIHFFFSLWDKISFCKPGTHYVNQTALNSKWFSASVSWELGLLVYVIKPTDHPAFWITFASGQFSYFLCTHALAARLLPHHNRKTVCETPTLSWPFPCESNICLRWRQVHPPGVIVRRNELQCIHSRLGAVPST